MYRAERQSYKLDLQLPDGTQLELFSFPSPPPRASYPEACGLRHLALRVADMDASVAWLAAHGVAVEPVRTDPVTGDLFTFLRTRMVCPLSWWRPRALLRRACRLADLQLLAGMAEWAHRCAQCASCHHCDCAHVSPARTLQLCLQPAPAQPAGGADPCWWLQRAAPLPIGWGVSRLTAGQHPPPWHSLEQALEGMRQLQAHSQTQPSSAAARWSWSQTLEHCAQSIEYSLGLSAAVFTSVPAHGRCGCVCVVPCARLHAARHQRAHSIGRPAGASADPASALQRLEAAAQAFLQHSGPLRPHFAYGALGAATMSRPTRCICGACAGVYICLIQSACGRALQLAIAGLVNRTRRCLRRLRPESHLFAPAIPIARNHRAGGSWAPAACGMGAGPAGSFFQYCRMGSTQRQASSCSSLRTNRFRRPAITSSSRRSYAPTRSAPKRWSKSRFRCTCERAGSVWCCCALRHQVQLQAVLGLQVDHQAVGCANGRLENRVGLGRKLMTMCASRPANRLPVRM